MADGDLLPRHEEISESFENASLNLTWRAAGPDHTDPATLTGSDLTAYKKWESDTQAEWAQAGRRVVQEYDRLNALGLGPGPGRAVVANPTFPRNNADAPWVALRALSRPKDTNGDPLTVTALPGAWAAVRRNPRDLASVLDAMRTAATASAGPAYYKSTLSRQFEGQVASAIDAVNAWTRLVTRTADPSLADLTPVANEINTRLDLVLKTAHGVAADVAAGTGVTVPQVPATLTDGVVMFVAAVADEICNQYAARIADPSFGLMFERISEIPSRGDVPSPGSQDYANSSAEAQRLDPKHALDLLQNRLLQIQGLDLTDYQAQALADATRVADFDSLSAAWKIWRTQLNAVPKQDMAALKTSISDLAFGLEQLRGAVSDALFQAPDLRVSALAPIDGLVALVQAQTEQAKALLR